ncbi:DNA-binding domain-containing protein [Parabacteroides sp.]
MSDIKLYADLYDNALTEKEGDCTARPRINGTLYNADIARRIVEKRTEYRPETIENILTMADEEKSLAIASGMSVVDGVGQYLPQIKGPFDKPTDPFDPAKHTLFVSYTSGKTLRKMLKETKVIINGQAVVGPVIGGLTDSATGKDDGTFTPGMPIVVSGNNIKIMGTNAANGFYFIPAAEGGTPVKATVIVHNNPSQLTVMVPADLAEGDYYISITTQYGRSATVKEPRTYKYPVLLSTAGSGGDDDDDRPVIE